MPTATTFTYKARATQSISANVAGSYTSIIPGLFYEGSAITLETDRGIVADTFEYDVTVQNVGGQDYFTIDGNVPGGTPFRANKNGMYIFKTDSTTNIGHPFRVSTTADGIHGGGVAYTDGVYVNGTEGTTDAYVRIYVTANTPSTLYVMTATLVIQALVSRLTSMLFPLLKWFCLQHTRTVSATVLHCTS